MTEKEFIERYNYQEFDICDNCKWYNLFGKCKLYNLYTDYNGHCKDWEK